MRRLLDFVYLCALSIAFPYLVYRSRRTGRYRKDFRIRFLGSVPRRPQTNSVVWVHAVSVGEVLLVKPLLKALAAARPDLDIALSSTTDAGIALATREYPSAFVFRAPLDFSWAIKSAMHRICPSLILLTEQELWPNLLLEAKRRGVPVAVVNARLSHRSYRGYKRLRHVLARPLSAVRWWGAQDEHYAKRICSILGEQGKAVAVTGSLKFDGALTDRDDPRVMEFKRWANIQSGEQVIVAGSTQKREEEAIIDLWKRLSERHSGLRLILSPRHPDRFSETADMLAGQGVTFDRRSHCAEGARSAVILWDTVGELRYVWGVASVGYVGGSLEGRRGGQNMIEPAALGVPTCFGPNTWNFRDVVEQILRVDGARQVRRREELLPIFDDWLSQPSAAQEVGSRARELVLSQMGAVSKTLAGLTPFLPPVGRGELKRPA